VEVLWEGAASDSHLVKRMERELALWKQLSVPRVGRLLEWGLKLDSESCFYWAKQLPPGRPLSDFLTPGVAHPQALNLIFEVLELLTAVHEKGLVLGNLSAERPVRIGADGITRLEGFIPQFYTTQVVECSNDLALGLAQAGYPSPEFIGTQDYHTEGHDQFGAGWLAYRLLTGRDPFEGKEPLHLLMSVLHSQPPEPQDLPPQLGQAVLRMLAKQPEQRFPSVAAALQELRRSAS
jgi:eukaryotic-like serine/threonine-protein kinase